MVERQVFLDSISSKITLEKRKRKRKIDRARRKNGGEEKKAMVALLVFILAYNGDLAGKKIIMETFSKVRPKPETAHEKPLAPRVERFCLLEMF